MEIGLTVGLWPRQHLIYKYYPQRSSKRWHWGITVTQSLPNDRHGRIVGLVCWQMMTSGTGGRRKSMKKSWGVYLVDGFSGQT